MNQNADRLLRALNAVPANGLLEPVWDPRAPFGFTYRAGGSALEDSTLAADLEELAGADYVERVFVEKIALCPECESPALNVHEACLSCASSNLRQFKALFHFRCGYVGPEMAFTKEAQGLRCPKCSRILADVGTDHDSPGDYFQCRSCTSIFQVPEIGARCLSCGAHLSGSAMQSIKHRDAFAYRLTPLGEAAVRERRLLEGAQDAASAQGGMERRHRMLDEIEKARQARRESGKDFSVIVVSADGDSAETASHVSYAVNRVTTAFKLGRLESDHLLVLLNNASRSVENAVYQKILDLASNGSPSIKAAFVDIADNEDLNDALEIAARQLAKHV